MVEELSTPTFEAAWLEQLHADLLEVIRLLTAILEEE